METNGKFVHGGRRSIHWSAVRGPVNGGSKWGWEPAEKERQCTEAKGGEKKGAREQRVQFFGKIGRAHV